MADDSDFSFIRTKKVSLWIFFIFFLSAITVLFIFPRHRIQSIDIRKSGEQYKHPIDIRQELVTSVREFVFSHEYLNNNDTQTCLYYGSAHGLFHPTVEHPRFIITGGAGFIGSHLVKRLRQLNYTAKHIKVLDSLYRGHLHNLQFENGTWAISIARDFCQVDLRNTKNALKFIRGADVVFHLADVVAGVNYKFSHESSVFRDNILINTNTIHSAKINNISNFIYTGAVSNSRKFWEDDFGIDDLRKELTRSVDSESSYAWSKLIGEYQTELARSNEFNVGILRLHNVYGPYSDYNVTSEQIIPSLIRKVLNSKNGRFIVWKSGKEYRDLIYVDDVVDSLVVMVEKGMNKGVIEIGSGNATTINELTHIICQLGEGELHKKIDIRFNKIQLEGGSGQIATLDRAKSILQWKPKVDIKSGVSSTMSWIRKTDSKQRVLVIIIGQARGGELAWKSLHKFLLRPLNGHLALTISDWEPRKFLHNISQYIWPVPEYADWGIVLDMAVKECRNNNVTGNWRNYCTISGIFMGGLLNCSHPGSSAISLALRWIVQQKIIELNLLDKYDWFIMTRADELYLCNHHHFFMMNRNHAILPVGEHSGGWSDRHIIGRPSVFMKMINITTDLVCRSDYWFEIFGRIKRYYNLEGIQHVLWSNMNISVSEFPRSMFTVRTSYDPTRWSQGSSHPDVAKFDLKLKYPGEFASTIEHCNISNVTNALEVIKLYDWEQYNSLLN